MENNINKTTDKAFPKIIFIILLLLSIHFWDLKFFPKMFNLQNLIVWLACGFCMIMLMWQKKKMHFQKAIYLFLIGLLFNVIASYVNLDQSPKQSLLSYSFYYFIVLYFFLTYMEFDRKFLEKTILTFGIIYTIIFTVQYILYPQSILNRDVNRAYGEIQLEILGHGFLMLSYFLVLNRFMINKRIINAILMGIFMLVLLRSGFRTLVGGALVGSAFMFLRMFRFRGGDIAIVVLVILLFVGLLQIKSVSSTIDSMIGKTQTEMKLGDRFNRIVDVEFFFTKYPRNISYFIIGGGKASGENISKFDKYALGQNYNIVWVDIGLLGFYIVIGGIATFGLLWYTLKAIFTRLPRDMFYLNFYFFYLLIVSFTNEEIYRNGIFSVHAIGLYLIDIAINERSMSKDPAMPPGSVSSELTLQK